MKNYIEKVEIIGLHNKFDIVQDLQPGINVIYGENGEFKTTFLHIIANILNSDFERFIHIEFNQISIHMKDGQSCFLRWNSENKDKLSVLDNSERRNIAEIYKKGNILTRRSSNLPKTAYFPTFRSIIEAWFSYESKDFLESQNTVKEIKKEVSDFLRNLFGNFVPNINFLSLPEIIKSLNKKIAVAASIAMQKDQEMTAEMASRISDVIIETQNIDPIPLDQKETKQSINLQDDVFSEINLLIKKIDSTPVGDYLILHKAIKEKIHAIGFDKNRISNSTTQVLFISLMNIYRDILKRELGEIENLFSEFTIYLASVNFFLRKKKIEIRSKSLQSFEPCLRLYHSHSDTSSDEDKNLIQNEQIKPQNLSSGERQVASLLYAAHISSQEVILIDEPEISLHTSWQENLLEELQKQIGDKQIIVCTHSPSIGANYIDAVQCMNISETDEDSWKYDAGFIEKDNKEEDNDDEEEDNDDKDSQSDEQLNEYKEPEYYKKEYEDQALIPKKQLNQEDESI